MSRFKKPGGYRRRVKTSTGTSRRARRDLKLRTEDVEGCRFPGPCDCPQCDPDADE